ncbi:MAG: hypothetical protein H7Z10_14940 [Gemmatimonadaceae bacterium]|nr:hypothetical protein [Acetobacteraceae bacterium]
MPALLAVCAAAIVLAWPAFLNGYPLVFSDTGGLVEMGLEPYFGWDKPYVYAPFLALFSAGQTLWGPIAAQALMVSWLLWLTARTVDRADPVRHIVLAAILAVGTAAPWFTALLMPDLFTPLVPLCLFVLVYARLSKVERIGIFLIGTVAIGAHLAHLVLAAACIAVLAMLYWRRAWRAAAPLATALVVLLATNAVGHGQLAISPYGSVFGVARLVGDGPGRAYLDRVCPDPSLRLCAWQGRLSADSDEFLWKPEGPMWAGDFNPVRFAPEAKRLVPAIIAAYPIETLQAAAVNTLRQLALVKVGDVLGDDHLSVAVLPRLRPYFPAAEVARYQAGMQPQDQLRNAAAPFYWLHAGFLLAGTAGSVWVLLRCWRTEPALAAFALLALAALVANAFATGALSGPHDRYQARIAWLVVLAPLFYAARAATSAGDIRTSAS